MKEEKKICAWCWYARMKRDICGIYCTGGFENPDGTAITFDTDYLGEHRGLSVMPGPFASAEAAGKQLW